MRRWAPREPPNRRVWMTGLSNAHHFRKMVAGFCMVCAPLLLLVGLVIHPETGTEASSTIAAAADDPDAWYAAHLLALVVAGPGGTGRPRAHAHAARARGGHGPPGRRARRCSASSRSSGSWPWTGSSAGRRPAGDTHRDGRPLRPPVRHGRRRDPVLRDVVRLHAGHALPGVRALPGARRPVLDGAVPRRSARSCSRSGSRRQASWCRSSAPRSCSSGLARSAAWC